MSYRTQPAGRIGFAAQSKARRTVASWPMTAAAAAVAAVMAFGAADANALALGRIKVLSTLGEPLRAEIDIPEISAAEAESLRASPASPETFRAAGLDYDSVVSSVRVAVQRRANGRPFLRLSSSRPVNDPFMDLIVNVSSSSGQISRDFTMLFDPQGGRGSAPTVIPPAAQSASRADASAATSQTRATSRAAAGTDAAGSTDQPAGADPAAAASARRGRMAAAVVAARNSKPAATPAAAVQPAPSPAKNGASQVKVRAGDTASKIAAANLPADVSLDQMLVAILRANPAAFVNGNVNRIRAGAVLEMPSAAQVAEQPAVGAREALNAQSKDFNAFRRKLATAAAPVPATAADRADSGKLQAAVQQSDPAGTSPDKLTLSKGSIDQRAPAGAPAVGAESAAANGSTPSAATAAAAAKKADASASPGNGTATIAGNTPSTSTGSGTAAPVSTTATAAGTGTGPAAPAPVVAGTDAAGIAPVTSTSAAAPVNGSTPGGTAANGNGKTAGGTLAMNGKPAATPSESGLVDQLIEEPVLPAAGLGLLALLTGFGIWRSRRARRAAGSEAARTESGSESIFSMSGGRSIDTLHGSEGVASIAYSPSQLDAGGEVDPVAEADVYMAYGREDEALEILKEAMRIAPARADVRVKLLEVHARRRETKAFEALAKETRPIVGLDSREWRHVCEIGRELDFQNSLYQAPISAAVPLQDTAGTPKAIAAPVTRSQPFSSGSSLDDFGATTAAAAIASASRQTPESFDLDLDFGALKAAAAPSQFSVPAALPSSATQPVGLDLDLSDFGSLEPTPAPKMRRAEPYPTAPGRLADTDGAAAYKPSFAATDLGQMPAAQAATGSNAKAPPALVPSTGMIDFDFSSLRLDLDDEPAAAPLGAGQTTANAVISAPLTRPERAGSADQAAALAAPMRTAAPSGDDADSLSTKLALAEAFSAIGDVDGARSLAHEVIGESSGTLKAKAQRFLASID